MSESTELIQLQEQPTLSIRGQVLIAALATAQGERLRALQAYLVKEAIPVAGAPFVRYHIFGDRETDFELGVPIVGQAQGMGEIKAGHLPGGSALVTEHIGSHDKLGEVYGRLQQAMSASNRQANGAAWEVYDWIDPVHDQGSQKWPAPADWHTHLIQPLKDQS